MMSVGIIENIPLRQGGTRLDGHQNHSNKAHRVRGRNTENRGIENNILNHSIMHKRKVIYEFIYKSKHITFNVNGMGFKRKTINDGVNVLIAISI